MNICPLRSNSLVLGESYMTVSEHLLVVSSTSLPPSSHIAVTPLFVPTHSRRSAEGKTRRGISCRHRGQWVRREHAPLRTKANEYGSIIYTSGTDGCGVNHTRNPCGVNATVSDRTCALNHLFPYVPSCVALCNFSVTSVLLGSTVELLKSLSRHAAVWSLILKRFE